MTPQLVLSHTASKDLHLSEAQFGDLLTLAPSEADADAHLLACAECAAELAAIRGSLTLFRDASRAHADSELRCLPEMTQPSRRLVSPVQEPGWWLAAAAILLTALLPMQIQRLRLLHTATAVSGEIATTSSAQSDEALLDEVDREASAALPSPMQALANPSTTPLEASTSIATQRKD
jgi:hypothetical protein